MCHVSAFVSSSNLGLTRPVPRNCRCCFRHHASSNPERGRCKVRYCAKYVSEVKLNETPVKKEWVEFPVGGRLTLLTNVAEVSAVEPRLLKKCKSCCDCLIGLPPSCACGPTRFHKATVYICVNTRIVRISEANYRCCCDIILTSEVPTPPPRGMNFQAALCCYSAQPRSETLAFAKPSLVTRDVLKKAVEDDAGCRNRFATPP